MQDKLERIALLKAYLETRRGRGHTFAMVHGVANTENVTVIACNQSHVKHIQGMCQKKINFVPWNNLEGLRGSDNAIAIDNAAMAQILGDALEAVREMRAENSRLVAELSFIKRNKK